MYPLQYRLHASISWRTGISQSVLQHAHFLSNNGRKLSDYFESNFKVWLHESFGENGFLDLSSFDIERGSAVNEEDELLMSDSDWESFIGTAPNAFTTKPSQAPTTQAFPGASSQNPSSNTFEKTFKYSREIIFTATSLIDSDSIEASTAPIAFNPKDASWLYFVKLRLIRGVAFEDRVFLSKNEIANLTITFGSFDQLNLTSPAFSTQENMIEFENSIDGGYVPTPLYHFLLQVQGNRGIKLPKLQSKKYELAISSFENGTDTDENPFQNEEVVKRLKFDILETFSIGADPKDAPQGALFYGPSGTGKTKAAMFIFEEVGAVSLWFGTGTELSSKYFGETEKKLDSIFSMCNLPEVRYLLCVVCFDEVDSLAPRRTAQTSEHKSDIVNHLLRLKISNMLLIGTSNRKYAIDPAMLRPGRLSPHLYFGRLNPDERIALLKKSWNLKVDRSQLAGVGKLDDDEKFENIFKKLTNNFTGALISYKDGIIPRAWRLLINGLEEYDDFSSFGFHQPSEPDKQKVWKSKIALLNAAQYIGESSGDVNIFSFLSDRNFNPSFVSDLKQTFLAPQKGKEPSGIVFIDLRQSSEMASLIKLQNDEIKISPMSLNDLHPDFSKIVAITLGIELRTSLVINLDMSRIATNGLGLATDNFVTELVAIFEEAKAASRIGRVAVVINLDSIALPNSVVGQHSAQTSGSQFDVQISSSETTVINRLEILAFVLEKMKHDSFFKSSKSFLACVAIASNPDLIELAQKKLGVASQLLFNPSASHSSLLFREGNTLVTNIGSSSYSYRTAITNEAHADGKHYCEFQVRWSSPFGLILGVVTDEYKPNEAGHISGYEYFPLNPSGYSIRITNSDVFQILPGDASLNSNQFSLSQFYPNIQSIKTRLKSGDIIGVLLDLESPHGSVDVFWRPPNHRAPEFLATIATNIKAATKGVKFSFAVSLNGPLDSFKIIPATKSTWLEEEIYNFRGKHDWGFHSAHAYLTESKNALGWGLLTRRDVPISPSRLIPSTVKYEAGFGNWVTVGSTTRFLKGTHKFGVRIESYGKGGNILVGLTNESLNGIRFAFPALGDFPGGLPCWFFYCACSSIVYDCRGTSRAVTGMGELWGWPNGIPWGTPPGPTTSRYEIGSDIGFELDLDIGIALVFTKYNGNIKYLGILTDDLTIGQYIIPAVNLHAAGQAVSWIPQSELGWVNGSSILGFMQEGRSNPRIFALSQTQCLEHGRGLRTDDGKTVYKTSIGSFGIAWTTTGSTKPVKRGDFQDVAQNHTAYNRVAWKVSIDNDAGSPRYMLGVEWNPIRPRQQFANFHIGSQIEAGKAMGITGFGSMTLSDVPDSQLGNQVHLGSQSDVYFVLSFRNREQATLEILLQKPSQKSPISLGPPRNLPKNVNELFPAVSLSVPGQQVTFSMIPTTDQIWNFL